MLFAHLKLIASYLAIFFAIYKIFGKKKHLSDYYLIIWLLTLFAFMFCKLYDTTFFIISENILSVPHTIILFLYIKIATVNTCFKPKDLLHFIPFAVVIAPVFFIEGYVFTSLFQILKLLLFVTYIILSILIVGKYKRRIMEDYADMSWLYVMIGVSLFFAVNLIIKLFYTAYPAELVEIIALFALMNILGLKGEFLAVKFFNQSQKIDNTLERKVAYNNYGLKSTDAEKLSERLGEYMKKEKPYLNQSLSLKDLAKAMDTYPHYITQVLSTVFNQNFYDFVNEYRVEEAERQLKSPSKAKFTILSIAYDCGFNSKATFNRVFKEKKGVTPTEYKLAIQ